MIRRYNHKTDFGACTALLKNENVTNIGLNKPFSTCFVSDISNDIVGLFVVSLYKKTPILQHFVIKKEARNKKSRIAFVSKNTLELLEMFDLFVSKLKSNTFVINLSVDKLRVCKFVKRYFGVRIEKVWRRKDKILFLVRVCYG